MINQSKITNPVLTATEQEAAWCLVDLAIQHRCNGMTSKSSLENLPETELFNSILEQNSEKLPRYYYRLEPGENLGKSKLHVTHVDQDQSFTLSLYKDSKGKYRQEDFYRYPHLVQQSPWTLCFSENVTLLKSRLIALGATPDQFDSVRADNSEEQEVAVFIDRYCDFGLLCKKDFVETYPEVCADNYAVIVSFNGVVLAIGQFATNATMENGQDYFSDYAVPVLKPSFSMQDVMKVFELPQSNTLTASIMAELRQEIESWTHPVIEHSADVRNLYYISPSESSGMMLGVRMPTKNNNSGYPQLSLHRNGLFQLLVKDEKRLALLLMVATMHREKPEPRFDQFLEVISGLQSEGIDMSRSGWDQGNHDLHIVTKEKSGQQRLIISLPEREFLPMPQILDQLTDIQFWPSVDFSVNRILTRANIL